METLKTYSQGHESNGCRLQTTSFPYSWEERWMKTAWKVLYLSDSYGKKNRLEMLSVLRMCVHWPFYKDNSNNMWQLQRKIILETNFFHIYILNYIFLSSHILCISLCITAWIKKNLNKSNVLISTEPINPYPAAVENMVSSYQS